MNSAPFICLVTLWSLAHGYQVTEKESQPPNLPLRPGDLLRSLDKLTSDVQVIYSPLGNAPTKSANRRAYDDENPYIEPGSENEYDRAYEDFVSKYFAQGEEDLESDDESGRSSDFEDAVPYESPAESEEPNKPESKQKSSKSKKCERVEIDDQDCVICEDPKTNEKSKSCSYSSDDKPKGYRFSRERSTKRSKDDDDDEDDQSAEDGRSIKREVVPKSDKIQPRRTSIKAIVSSAATPEKSVASKCTRKKEDGMICYYCGSAAKHTRECLADRNSPTKKHRLDESSKNDSKTKKVFKRMVSYSFKSDADPKINQNSYAVFQGY